MIRVGLIRVISGLSPKRLDSHANLLQKLLPYTHIITIAIRGFPRRIYNPELARQTVPEIVRAGLQVAPSADVFVLACSDFCTNDSTATLANRLKVPVLNPIRVVAAHLAGAFMILRNLTKRR